jgi:phosphohistidine phosphatase
MKRLTLVRHANAAWKNSQTSDFDRPLTRRGQAEAEALARHLLGQKLVPDLLIASPALRAKQTAETLVREMQLPANATKYEERLYLAHPADLLRTARSPGPHVQHLMIVGHNPGMSELARLLAPQTELAELATATACTMLFDAGAWPALEYGLACEVRYESRSPGLFGLFR